MVPHETVYSRISKVGVPHRSNFQVPVPCGAANFKRERGRVRKIHLFVFIEQVSIDIGRAGTYQTGEGGEVMEER